VHRKCLTYRSWTGYEIDASFLCSSEERFKSKYTLCGIVTRLSFEQSPMYVERYGVEAQCLDLLEHVQPEIRNRQSIWMEFATEHHDTFTIDHQGMFIISDLFGLVHYFKSYGQ
jgi:hypothetical protein